MKLVPLTLRVSAVLACLSLPLLAQARSGIIPSPRDSQTEFHVEVGITYASGMNNVVNQLKKNFGLEDDNSFPLGLKITAIAKLPSGLAFGGGFGPCQYYRVRTYNPRYGSYYNQSYYYDDYYYDSGYRYSYDDYQESYIFPVFADIRYYFPKNSVLTPFVRAGIAYPISGGDFLSAGIPGAIGAIGAQFIETRYFAMGVEVGYDDSKVQVKSGPFHPKEKVRPTEWTISLFAAF